MTKQTLELEVPDGYELAGEYRAPRLGETYLSHRGAAITHTGNANMSSFNVRLILRPIWQWPEWLKAGWIAMDNDGSWWGYSSCPKLNHTNWLKVDDSPIITLEQTLIDFIPPHCCDYDWTKSLRKNPNLGD